MHYADQPNNKREFPYRVVILRRIWTPNLQKWLKENVGSGNFMYVKPHDPYETLRYGFRNQEDATAFKLRFG